MFTIALPLKRGTYRVANVSPEPTFVPGAVWLSPATHARWELAWNRWWLATGHRLDHSPEMWERPEKSRPNGIVGEE